MSSGYIIQGSHAVDILSTNASEALTIGNTGLATTIRIYDCNAPLNGYLLTTSNNVFSITEANNTTPCVGIGTTTPISTATLQVAGTFLTSNIGTYNTGNTLYFNNTNLASINNITTTGYITTTTPGSGDNSTNVATTQYVQTAISGLSGGGGGVTSSNTASTMPYLTSIGATNLTTSILGNAIVNSNTTVNGTLTAQNLVCGSTCNSSLSYTFATKTIAVNMNSNSYNIFKCNASGSIQVINATNIIVGSQAIIYVTATTGITINGNSGSANLTGTPNPLASYSSIALANGNKAIISFTYDGINTYFNASQYS